MMKNMMVTKFDLAFTRCWNNSKRVRNLTVKNLLQDVNAKEMYLHPKNRWNLFQSIEKCSFLAIFKCSHDAVSKMFQLSFRFQNLLFSNSAGIKCTILT